MTEAATLVERAAVRADADLSPVTKDPARAVSAYEALFARGVANTRMMERHLIALSHTGASAAVAAATNPDVFFRRTELALPQPTDGFLARVADALQRAQAREFQSAHRSIRNMDRVLRTHLNPDPDLRRLHQVVARQMRDYTRDVRSVGHMIAPSLPDDFSLGSWGAWRKPVSAACACSTPARDDRDRLGDDCGSLKGRARSRLPACSTLTSTTCSASTKTTGDDSSRAV